MIKLTCKIAEIYQQSVEGHVKRVGWLLRLFFREVLGSSRLLRHHKPLFMLLCEGMWLYQTQIHLNVLAIVIIFKFLEFFLHH